MSLVTDTSPQGRKKPKQPNMQNALLLFITILSPILLILALLSAALYSYQKESLHTHHKQITAGQLSAIHEVLDHELNDTLMDSLFLTNYPTLLDYLELPNEANHQKINTAWQSFSNQKRIYDQVRFIDTKGNEIIRINNNNGSAIAVPFENLQAKKKRYYFKKTSPLKKNDIYLSPLDLNIEEGTIEMPYKPTIRIATPLFDPDGNAQGIIVLNYLAKRLFEIIDTVKMQSTGDILLVNKQGFYLRGLTKEDEWGFMFGSKGALKTMAHQFPLAWQIIKQHPSGHIDNIKGQFIYKNFKFPATHSKLKSSSQREWTLIHYTSDKERLDLFLPILEKILFTVVSLCFILIPIVFFITKLLTQKQHAQRLLRSNEHYLRLILGSTTEGIIGIDQKGRTIFANTAAQNMVDYNQDELIGRYIQDWIYLENDESKSHLSAECKIIHCLKSGEHHKVKVEAFRHKNGSHFPIECQFMPLIEAGEFQGAVITFRDITERLRIEQELQHRASFDSLTGIYNRLKFEELLEQEILESNRYRRPLSIAMFDIDHFKLINDAHGHQVGDSVLKEISQLTLLTLRDVDSFARWGGEEFMILAPETTLNGVTKIAEKIRNVIACNKFQSVEQVTISFGVAQFKYGETEDDFLKRTDDALYVAKQLGRNRVERSE
jgi:diguanylate cyclase (GGDEF)-like protein/PAS domain S-box-containing protein